MSPTSCCKQGEESITSRFAAWAVDFSWANLPESGQEKARACFLDWLAAAASGAAHPLAKTYLALAQELGGETGFAIAGRKERTSKIFALFTNAALGHITENDDGHRRSIMHPGNVVFPVVVCLAPLARQPARAAVEAAVVGYEAAVRLGVAFGQDHYATWHTTATAGVFGAAATAAKLMGLGKEAFASALGLAGTQSAGVWQFLDDGCVAAKAFHPAKACLSGYLAAAAAAKGLPGAPRILEGEKGLLVALGKGSNPQEFIRELGKKFALEEVNFKGYPTCGQTHSMLDATSALCKKHGLTASNVKTLEARIYTRAAQVAGNPNPQNPEEAKFSIVFCLAYLLVHGRIPFSGFTGANLSAPDIRELMGRITLTVDPEMDAGFPQARPCRVIATTKDGRTFSEDNLFRKGDPENPMSFDEIAEKFRELADGVYTPGKMETIIAAVRSLCRDTSFALWPDLSPDFP